MSDFKKQNLCDGQPKQTEQTFLCDVNHQSLLYLCVKTCKPNDYCLSGHTSPLCHIVFVIDFKFPCKLT